jgi:hypothetical protein
MKIVRFIDKTGRAQYGIASTEIDYEAENVVASDGALKETMSIRKRGDLL